MYPQIFILSPVVYVKMSILSLVGINSGETKSGSFFDAEGCFPPMRFSVALFLRSLLGLNDDAPVFGKNTLFPAICKEKLMDLSNNCRGFAKNCAADDFDLSLNATNDQVEVFGSYQHPDFYNPIYVPNGDFKSSLEGRFPGGRFPEGRIGNEVSASGRYVGHGQISSSFDYTEYSSFSHPSSHSFYKEEGEMNSTFPTNQTFINQQQYANDYVSRDVASNHQSHFTINAYGINSNPTFTDFRPHPLDDCLSYGSSLGSLVSPLDDLLFPGPCMQVEMPFIQAPDQKKRKVPKSSLENLSDAQTDNHLSKRLKIEYPLFLDDPIELSFNSCDVKNDTYLENKGRFKCNECDASFKVKSYLTRHSKKHTNSKAFVCPFFNSNNVNDSTGAEMANKCHSSGGFSRKDTYTTHMKALHFVYPPRTKSSQRNSLGGRCTGCYEYFDNNASWLKNHIEARLCPGILNSSGREQAEVKQEPPN